jgi:WD40-like Beta Propeller Repeat
MGTMALSSRGRGSRTLAAVGVAIPVLLAATAPGAVLPWKAEGPAPRARLFAPGVISTGDDDAHVTFDPDGRHVFFLKATPDFRFWTIAVVEWTGSGWGTPQVAPFSGRWAEGDLSFAPDGKTAYFVSTRPVAPATQARADTEIWRLHRTAKGWAQPEHVAELGSDGFEWYPNMTADGWLYFGSERAAGNLGAPRTSDLWRARLAGDRFSVPENLGPILNTAGEDIEPWISADGRLLLFASNGRPDTRGSYDIYVSHRCGESWSAPRPLGADVNSSAWDFGPRESPDGRFLFFTSNRSTTDRPPERALSFKSLVARIRGPQNGLRDVYRVETAALDLVPTCPRP